MKQASKQASKQAAIPADVYVFGTCIVDVAFADAGMDAIAVLESMGIRVHYPEQQTCCGQPAFNAGMRSEARVMKERFGLDLPGGEWVLDVFEAANAPLVIAEVELESEQAAVAIPTWCGPEITGQGVFSNAALAQRPFQVWPKAEQEPWLLQIRSQRA